MILCHTHILVTMSPKCRSRKPAAKKRVPPNHIGPTPFEQTMTAETPNEHPVESAESTLTTSNGSDTVKNSDEAVTLQGEEEQSTVIPTDTLSEVDETAHEHDDASDAHEHTDDESDGIYTELVTVLTY